MTKSSKEQASVLGSRARRRLRPASPMQSGPQKPVVSSSYSNGKVVSQDPGNGNKNKEFDFEEGLAVCKRSDTKESEKSNIKITFRSSDT